MKNTEDDKENKKDKEIVVLQRVRGLESAHSIDSIYRNAEEYSTERFNRALAFFKENPDIKMMTVKVGVKATIEEEEFKSGIFKHTRKTSRLTLDFTDNGVTIERY